MKPDIGLAILLDLHGTEYTEENGYWYRIEAWKVTPSTTVPHGIRYNLTLHDPSNMRIPGFDNAHAVTNTGNAKYRGRIVAYDHLHASVDDKGTPYQFESANQLLQDFLTAVDQALRRVPP